MNKRKHKKKMKRIKSKIKLIGCDLSNGEDFSCTTYGHYELDGTITITDITYGNKVE